MRNQKPAERREKAMHWLERLGVAEFAERNVDTLSGGQRQRVALARSLVTEPQLLLLDEPLSALDAHLVIRMQSVLTQLQRELGITFVYVTHSQSEAFAMADRVVVMTNGDEVNDGLIRVDAPMGKFSVPAGDKYSAAVGDKVTFVIAADLVQVTRSKTELDNTVECSLISEEFVGSMVTLFLETADGTEFKVQLQERELATLDHTQSEQFYLSWQSNNAHLLAPD